MESVKLKCENCRKTVYRRPSRCNEAKKFGWKTYCSVACQGAIRNKQKFIECSRRGCGIKFFRGRRAIIKAKNSYCSRSCAVAVNNSISPKRKKKFIKNKCAICGKYFFKLGTYCSVQCKCKGQTTSKEEVVSFIKNFHRKNKRLPFRAEISYAHAARARFGTWNNAIKAAGFTPNPVKFTRRYKATDGHMCDSLSEKIIDDWLYAKRIKHLRAVPYPSTLRLTCDFVVEDYFIEFFGLENEHKRYTELVNEKRKIVKQHNLRLVELKPIHIFPKNKLDEVLWFLTKQAV